MVPPWTQQSQRCITQWQSYVEIGNFKKKLGFFCMWSSIYIYICVTCMILCMISSHNNICLFIAIHTRLNMLTKKHHILLLLAIGIIRNGCSYLQVIWRIQFVIAAGLWNPTTSVLPATCTPNSATLQKVSWGNASNLELVVCKEPC